MEQTATRDDVIVIDRAAMSHAMREVVDRIPGSEQMTPEAQFAALRALVAQVVRENSTFDRAARDARLSVTRHTLRSWLEKLAINVRDVPPIGAREGSTA